MDRARRRCLASLLLAVACSRGDAPAPQASSRSKEQRATPVDSLLRLGDGMLRQAPESARVLYTAALTGAGSLGDSAAIAKALTGLGQAARPLGEMAEARRLGEQALALKLRLNLAADLSRSYNALGLVARDEERFVDAVGLFTQASESARAADDTAGLAKATINIGLVLDNLGSFDAARRALEAGRDLARIVGDSVNLGRALTNLAALDISLGDPIAALANLENARRLFHATFDSTGELNALAQLARAHDALGDAQATLATLDSAQRMAHRLGFRPEEAEDLTLLGDAFAQAGDYRHALDHYARALAATDSVSSPEERGNILRSAARVYALSGNHRLAAERVREALRTHRLGGFRWAELEDRLLLAELTQEMKLAGESAVHLRAASQLAVSLDADVATARVALTAAGIALASGQPRRTLQALDDARPSLGLLGAGATAEAMALRARAYGELGQLEAAIAAGAQAIAAVERIRVSYRSDELRTSYASGKSSLYAEQALRLLRANRSAEAFRVADAARGRALLEHLAVARADVRAADRASTTLEKEEILRHIDALAARLRERASHPPERSAVAIALNRALSDSLIAARNEYEALVAKTSADTRTLENSLLGAGARLTEVKAALADGEAVVEYLVTAEKLLTFVITRTGLSTYEVREPSTTLASRVRLARELLQQPVPDTVAGSVLRALHGLLLEPVEAAGALRGIRRLVVIPHGVLTYLPFAALVDFRSGRYVVEQYSVLHASTAAAFVAMREEATKDAGRPGGVVAGVVFAPFPNELPATREESRSFLRAVRASSANLGSAATESRLREAIAAGKVVHVATHAVMNPRNPLFSRIELAGDRSGPNADDGRLEVHELLALRSSSPLVFLSGCETALGAAGLSPFDTGEDFTTMGQALLYAGARNVVATLWRIDDAAASEFAGRFYEMLKSRSATDALATAQREMIADPRLRNPYLWAAYQVSGNGGETFGPANARVVSDKR
jgi:CHAT domain-containing protein